MQFENWLTQSKMRWRGSNPENQRGSYAQGRYIFCLALNSLYLMPLYEASCALNCQALRFT
jgi:hypothetical protein